MYSIESTMPVALGLLLFSSVPVLFLAFAVPIYTDEIVWKILQARYFLDGGLLNNGFPQCGPHFLLPPPVTHLPARVLDAWLYQDLAQPLKLRIAGLLGAGTLLGVFYVLIRTVVCPVPRRTTAIVIVLVVWGLGLMPLLSVMNRPELPILLGVSTLVLGALRMRPSPPRALRSEPARLMSYLLLVLMVLGAHPKAIAFAPLFLASGCLWLRWWSSRAVAAVVLLAALVQTNAFAVERYACPNDSWTAEKLAEVAVPLDDLLQRPAHFLAQARTNVRATPKYFGHLVFQGTYMAGWLPDHPRVPWVDDLGDRLIYLAITVIFAGLLAVSVHALWVMVRSRRWDAPRVLLLALLPALVAQVALQSHKNAYDGAFLVTLGGLGLALGWPPDIGRRGRRALLAVLVFLTFTTLLSEGRLLYHFGPWATGAWLSGGNLPGPIEGTISGFHYASVNREVLDTARSCGIEVTKRPKFLLVDDLTYPALTGARYPLHTMGVSWWGAGIADQYEFLKAFGSEGVVVRCRSVTPELQARARRRGDLCCLPRFADPAERDESD